MLLKQFFFLKGNMLEQTWAGDRNQTQMKLTGFVLGPADADKEKWIEDKDV